jgi:hypothetical protein
LSSGADGVIASDTDCATLVQVHRSSMVDPLHHARRSGMQPAISATLAGHAARHVVDGSPNSAHAGHVA